LFDRYEICSGLDLTGINNSSIGSQRNQQIPNYLTWSTGYISTGLAYTGGNYTYGNTGIN
jgi:hypothetical protein